MEIAPLLVLKVNRSCGGGMARIEAGPEPKTVYPRLLVAARATEKVPLWVKVWEGFWSRLVEPSPKSQFQLVIGLPPLSTPAAVKFTVSGAKPLAALAVNGTENGTTVMGRTDPATGKPSLPFSTRTTEKVPL